MNPSFYFVGHETVGTFVARCLEPFGWVRVGDVSQAAVAFSYCTSQTALEDAYFDGEGLVKRSKPGTLLVDLSPSTPAFARELSAVATVNDLRPVEAPLSVVDPALSDAFISPDNVMCYVAGEDDDVDEAIDLLETIAQVAVRTGLSGSAQLAKASRTTQVAAIIASAIEAEALVRATHGVSMSLDALEALVQPVCGAAVSSIAAAATDEFEGTYTVEMLAGEVSAAMMAADDVGLILPQLESVMHLLEVLAVIGGAGKAPAALALMYREEAASAAQGLDWARAEGLFSDMGCDHDHDHDYDDGYDDGYDDDDDLGFYGSFGGYSAN